jgi:hypothetical protein
MGANRAALLKERDEAREFLKDASNALSDILHHGAMYPETGETHQADPDTAMVTLKAARAFLSILNTHPSPSLSVDEVMEVVTRALYDNDNTNWQSPPRSYNEERDKLLRERLTKAITRS